MTPTEHYCKHAKVWMPGKSRACYWCAPAITVTVKRSGES